jgi:hexosaminidase
MRPLSCLILVAALPFCTLRAQDVPVLPLPVHIEKGSDKVAVVSSADKFHFNGTDEAITERLREHWQVFAKTQPTKTPVIKEEIQIGLIGKDKTFDNLVKSLVGKWCDSIGKEGYVLVFNKKQRVIAANTETGLFYALQTIKQLIRANWQQELLVADWPSFEHRSVYDDISRGPISTVAYIKEQIERLSELKINELSFYIEHVVQPVSYPDFAPVNGKLTIADIKELSAYAAKYHVQLVGSFQSFGHFDKILALPQYRSMGETSTLISPLDPNAKKFLETVIGELCDAFSSPYFNVNCDETFDLGKGKSKAYIDSVGPAKYYADHIKFLYDVVKKHNKKLMIWGDIALEHEEILDMLPKDIMYLTWEYGGQSSFDKWIAPFQKRGLSFMVCPGVLNSYRLIPDMTMAFENIEGFLPEGKAKGAAGVITTVWDDGGAYLFSGDWYGVYKGADKSWNVVPQNKKSFDKRYNIAAYGTTDAYYTSALDSMMQLRRLPLTYNLTDNIWNQKLLPDSGRQLILNNANTDEALRIIRSAEKLIATAKPKRNQSDINTLRLSIDQYRLIMDGRKQIPAVSASYREAMNIVSSNPSKAVSLLTETANTVTQLKNRYIRLTKTFRTAWLSENQLYSLEIAARPYEERIGNLQRLESQLVETTLSIINKTYSINKMGSYPDVIANDHIYFQNWLLCGPFAIDNITSIPAFLYSGDAPQEKAPKPGDLISFKNKNYRWQKYASPNGGITELDDFYRGGNKQAAYAFCTITTEKALTIESFVAANSGVEMFCNGVKVSAPIAGMSSVKKEEKIKLTLKAGVNNILFKIPSGNTAWSFSFRLEPRFTVTNQKYKYFINTEKGSYEAE